MLLGGPGQHPGWEPGELHRFWILSSAAWPWHIPNLSCLSFPSGYFWLYCVMFLMTYQSYFWGDSCIIKGLSWFWASNSEACGQVREFLEANFCFFVEAYLFSIHAGWMNENYWFVPVSFLIMSSFPLSTDPSGNHSVIYCQAARWTLSAGGRCGPHLSACQRWWVGMSQWGGGPALQVSLYCQCLCSLTFGFLLCTFLSCTYTLLFLSVFNRLQ